jgi:hypothetical protein
MTTEAEAYENAGRVFAAILADPERRAEIRRDLAARDTQTPAPAGTTPRASAGVGTNGRRKSA